MTQRRNGKKNYKIGIKEHRYSTNSTYEMFLLGKHCSGYKHDNNLPEK